MDRQKFTNILYDLSNIEIKDKGELEYLIFSIMQEYMRIREKRYTTLHDCVYAVQHCSDEFRRRFLDIRENNAMDINGDIF
jgi:hypothetical protein